MKRCGARDCHFIGEAIKLRKSVESNDDVQIDPNKKVVSSLNINFEELN